MPQAALQQSEWGSMVVQYHQNKKYDLDKDEIFTAIQEKHALPPLFVAHPPRLANRGATERERMPKSQEFFDYLLNCQLRRSSEAPRLCLASLQKALDMISGASQKRQRIRLSTAMARQYFAANELDNAIEVLSECIKAYRSEGWKDQLSHVLRLQCQCFQLKNSKEEHLYSLLELGSLGDVHSLEQGLSESFSKTTTSIPGKLVQAQVQLDLAKSFPGQGINCSIDISSSVLQNQEFESLSVTLRLRNEREDEPELDVKSIHSKFAMKDGVAHVEGSLETPDYVKPGDDDFFFPALA